MADLTNALATAQPNNPRFASGKKTKTVDLKLAITSAGAANGDKHILSGPHSYADRIAAIRPRGQGTPALTSAADNDLGFYYKNEDGDLVELDKDILWDGVTLASALTYPDLLTGLNASLDESKNIGQHLGKYVDQEPFGGVYLVLTMNTASTANGTLRLSIDVDEGTTQ